jgi:hypothetical protein
LSGLIKRINPDVASKGNLICCTAKWVYTVRGIGPAQTGKKKNGFTQTGTDQHGPARTVGYPMVQAGPQAWDGHPKVHPMVRAGPKEWDGYPTVHTGPQAWDGHSTVHPMVRAGHTRKKKLGLLRQARTVGWTVGSPSHACGPARTVGWPSHACGPARTVGWTVG